MNGKGDKPRPCDKKRYDRNYTYAFGIDCWFCNGKGKVLAVKPKCTKEVDCPDCGGLGRVDKRKVQGEPK